MLYELNTRCWLRELSAQRGSSVRLGTVPEAEFRRWHRLGFTYVWLMGLWATGRQSYESYLHHPDTARHLQEILPDWRKEDVSGSPYAIAEYRVPETFGGDAGLKAFREKLHGYGLRLMLDFVPNHVGLDHPWVTERSELFVQSRVQAPGTFFQQTKAGPRWLAHGKDPYFPPWFDTVQLDYRRADTRAAVTEELRSVAQRCDGVRCDMAMLLLNDVFTRNWQQFPCAERMPETEFWADVIAPIKLQRSSEFLFLAEAYWDLEQRLQSLGFDLTYDKRVLDFLVERRPAELQRHLLDKGDEFLRRSVHFLENHDEPRIATRLSLAEHRAAALLMVGLPGRCLLHEGQLAGARIRASVHLSRRSSEPVDGEVAGLYERLLGILPRTAVGKGVGRLLQPASVSSGDESARNVVAIHWRGASLEFDLVAVNLAPVPSRCWLRLPDESPVGGRWRAISLLGQDVVEYRGEEMHQRGLQVELKAHATQLFHFVPSITEAAPSAVRGPA